MFSLIIPTYNEASNIPECVRRAESVLRGSDYEILIVDDDSPDETWRVAEALGNQRVRVLRRTTNRGLSAAVRDGFKFARGELLGVMDADLQHDESILPELIRKLETCDLAVGSRTAPGGSAATMSGVRSFISKGASALANVFVAPGIGDPMSGFFVLRRDLVERIAAQLDLFPARDYKILLQVMSLAGNIRCAEVGYKFRERHEGQSKLGIEEVAAFVRFLVMAQKLRRAASSKTEVLEVDAELPPPTRLPRG